MTTTSVTLSGFVYDNAGNAVQDATVAAYASADNATSAIAGLTDTTDANGRWDLTTTDEAKYPMDIRIAFGSSVRWIKAGNGINVTRLTVSGASVFGEDDTGVDVTMYGATSGSFLLWDESEDALKLTDSTPLKIGDGGDMTVYHDGSNSYITNATGALKLATETSGIAITIGHSTSEVTVADNLTVTGDLTVSGTTTTINTVTMNAANAVVFEGATANDYETTLTIEDPTADRTVVIPNVSGTLAVLAADSDTAITSTPAELNLLDGVSGLVQADFTKLAAVDATAAELNLLDGGTSVGSSITILDSDGFIVNDGGTMKVIPASDINTYVGDNDTTYSAGDGLGLSSTTFSVDLKANGGLEIQSAELSVAQGVSQYDVAQFGAGISNDDFLRIDGTSVEGLSAAEVAAAIEGSIDAVGTIASGTWQGTAIASAYIAADAITGAKIADNAIDSEHYAAGSIDNEHLADDAVDSDELAAGAIDTTHIGDNQVTVAKLADIARGSIIVGNASAASAELTIGSDGYVLTSDGTDISWVASTVGDITNVIAGAGMTGGATSGEATLNVIGGTGITANADDIAVDASLTHVTHVGALEAGSITSNFGNIDIGASTFDTTGAVSTGNLSPAGDVAVADAKAVKLGGTRPADDEPASNNTGYGVVVLFDAGAAVAIGDAVSIGTDGRVIKTVADAGSLTGPCIGIATTAAGSADDDVYVMTHGIFRHDDWDFGTKGQAVFVEEADPGDLSLTAPNDDGDHAQRVGVAVTDDVLLVMPSIDVIEHAG